MANDSRLHDLVRYARAATASSLNIDERQDADGLAAKLLRESPDLAAAALDCLLRADEHSVAQYVVDLCFELRLEGAGAPYIQRAKRALDEHRKARSRDQGYGVVDPSRVS